MSSRNQIIKCQLHELGDEKWYIKLPSKSSKAGQYVVGVSVSRGGWQATAALTNDRAAIEDLDPMASDEELERAGAIKLYGIADEGAAGDVMCFEVVPDKEYFIENTDLNNWFCGLFLGTEDEVRAYIDDLGAEKGSASSQPEGFSSSQGLTSDDYEITDDGEAAEFPEGMGTKYKTVDHGAYANTTNLRSVVIPDGVTEIAACAFWNCPNLTSVEIPNSVTKIGWAAFHNCPRLTSLTLPDSIDQIEKSAFAECGGLKDVVLPESLDTIPEMMFANCSKLTSISIPDSVAEIQFWAFHGCDSLQSVEVPAQCQVHADAFPKHTRIIQRKAIFNENTKITLTLGQIKKLIRESFM